MERRSLSRAGLVVLLEQLVADEQELIAPVFNRGVVKVKAGVDIDAAVDTLLRARDAQAPGSYSAHMASSSDDGAQSAGAPRITRATSVSWRRHLAPPEETVWSSGTTPGVSTSDAGPGNAGTVFFGMRGCDIAAMSVLDKIWAAPPFADAGFVARRSAALVVAVDCSAADGDNTCFCASMGTGPSATSGFDLALTVISPDSFVVRSGSQAGADVLEAARGSSPHEVTGTSPEDMVAVEAVNQAALASLGRTLPMQGLKEKLYASLQSPSWESAAERCLSCGNCTLICPTCFCNKMSDHTGLGAGEMSRERKWDSCFSLDHSYIHGGHMRESIRSRYRQWLTHKLATWQDQFGVAGCTGCGRCITWCPSGIDITEEAKRVTQEA